MSSPADASGQRSGPKSRAWRQLYRKQFRKTKLCRFFPAGECKYVSAGEDCPYAHDQSEIEYPPDLTKTALCQKFAQGLCPLSSEECQFAHGQEELRATETFSQSPLCKRPGDRPQDVMEDGSPQSQAQQQLFGDLSPQPQRQQRQQQQLPSPPQQPVGPGPLPLRQQHQPGPYTQPALGMGYPAYDQAQPLSPTSPASPFQRQPPQHGPPQQWQQDHQPRQDHLMQQRQQLQQQQQQLQQQQEQLRQRQQQLELEAQQLQQRQQQWQLQQQQHQQHEQLDLRRQQMERQQAPLSPMSRTWGMPQNQAAPSLGSALYGDRRPQLAPLGPVLGQPQIGIEAVSPLSPLPNGSFGAMGGCLSPMGGQLPNGFQPPLVPQGSPLSPTLGAQQWPAQPQRGRQPERYAPERLPDVPEREEHRLGDAYGQVQRDYDPRPQPDMLALGHMKDLHAGLAGQSPDASTATPGDSPFNGRLSQAQAGGSAPAVGSSTAPAPKAPEQSTCGSPAEPQYIEATSADYRSVSPDGRRSPARGWGRTPSSSPSHGGRSPERWPRTPSSMGASPGTSPSPRKARGSLNHADLNLRLGAIFGPGGEASDRGANNSWAAPGDRRGPPASLQAAAGAGPPAFSC